MRLVVLLFLLEVLSFAQPGTIDTSFDPGTGANNTIWSTLIQPDGKILICGNFTVFDGVSINRIARLNSDGSLDNTFNPGTGADSYIYDMALQDDGKIIIVGNFTTYNGTNRLRVARINPGGSLDFSFDPGTGAGGGEVRAVDIQSDGKIIIGGNYLSYNGNGLDRLTRINVDGSPDPTFNSAGTGASNSVLDLDVQPDDMILIGGQFTSYNGSTYNRIMRLNSDGSPDMTFDAGTGANGTVWDVDVQADGKIAFSGDYTQVDGIGLNRVCRLNSDGSIDFSFSPITGADDAVYGIGVQWDNKIVCGGAFYNFNGSAVSEIARADVDGSTDVTWVPVSGSAGGILNVSIQPDGQIIIAGNFWSYDGVSRNGVARINGDGCGGAPAQPSTIIGDTIICGGATGTYSVTIDPSASSYTWTIPAGWTGTSTTNSINVTSSLSSGTIEVTSNNACGSSSIQSLFITVEDVPPPPSTIIGNLSLCEGDSVNYWVSNNPSTTDYTWILPGGWSGTSTTNSIDAIAGSSGGIIQVIANNICGSSVPQNATVIVSPLPDVSVTLSGITLTANNSNAGATYQWIDCDNSNSIIGGEINQSFSPASNGNYAVIITENSCPDTSLCYSIFGVGVESLEKSHIEIYPNPFENHLTINVPIDDSDFSVKFEVINILGEIVYSDNHVKNLIMLDLSDIPDGVYFFQVLNEDEILFQKRIIKQ